MIDNFLQIILKHRAILIIFSGSLLNFTTNIYFVNRFGNQFIAYLGVIGLLSIATELGYRNWAISTRNSMSLEEIMANRLFVMSASFVFLLPVVYILEIDLFLVILVLPEYLIYSILAFSFSLYYLVKGEILKSVFVDFLAKIGSIFCRIIVLMIFLHIGLANDQLFIWTLVIFSIIVAVNIWLYDFHRKYKSPKYFMNAYAYANVIYLVVYNILLIEISNVDDTSMFKFLSYNFIILSFAYTYTSVLIKWLSYDKGFFAIILACFTWWLANFTWMILTDFTNLINHIIISFLFVLRFFASYLEFIIVKTNLEKKLLQIRLLYLVIPLLMNFSFSSFYVYVLIIILLVDVYIIALGRRILYKTN